MKHTVVTKFIAIALAACALVALVGSIVGMTLIGQLGLYAVDDYQEWLQEESRIRAGYIAEHLAARYARNKLGDLPPHVAKQLFYSPYDGELTEWYSLREDSWSYRITSEDGQVLEASDYSASGNTFIHTISTRYFMMSSESESFDHMITDSNGAEYYLAYAYSPSLTITVSMDPDALASYNDIALSHVQQFFDLRPFLIPTMGFSILLFAICLVYLCCAAGKNGKSGKVTPTGLNRLPLDVYAAGGFGLCFLLGTQIVFIFTEWFLNNASYNLGALTLAAVLTLTDAVILVGFLFALAAQVKLRKSYWLRHTFIGWLCIQIFKGLGMCFNGLRRLFGLMPVIWRWLLVLVGFGVFLILAALISLEVQSVWPLLTAMALCTAAILYIVYAYGILLTGTKKLAAGELDFKVPTQYLLGSFRRSAEDLNTLAEVATQAAKKQMQSERMRTELITNVSHDIKTPLTSIINYVDLLQKPHSPEESRQYLEVLGRQSLRMKKLVEDLVEMSKASSGNMPVEIIAMDAVETVNQALGEFSDKLSRADVTPVFQPPETPIPMLADGRLAWRVLSNLLSNAVKYTMPGTRLYVDLTAREDAVLISLKNISREPLNISAEELTERFVRGDQSRNTEGSGLGLNIAKSLMELQKGNMELMVDGDLFKVVLTFPRK